MQTQSYAFSAKDHLRSIVGHNSFSHRSYWYCCILVTKITWQWYPPVTKSIYC